MKARYAALVNKTGASGTLSEMDQEIKRVMADDKDAVGDTVGSSSEGIQIRGTLLETCCDVST